jgi:toxin ParE1/3/4
MLGRMPKAGRARSDVAAGLRSFPVDKYLIYYRQRERGRISISRVLHGKRDQRAAFLN